ncbi:MAG: DHH family phosphoesterase [Hyphomonadaceae bacterium]|nr:DHH family phosphoesterase [Clostridia bacterium]
MRKLSHQKIYRLFMPRVNLYTMIIIGLILAIAQYNLVAAASGTVALACLFFVNRKQSHQKTKEMVKYIENLTFHVDTATKDSLLKFPLPMVVLDLEGVVTWYNPPFEEIFEGVEIFERALSELVEGVELDKFVNRTELIDFEIPYQGRHYRLFGNFVQTGNTAEDYMIVLYWVDNTELVGLRTTHMAQKNVTAIVMIDNYDELVQGAEDNNRPHLMAEIDRRIGAWLATVGGLLRKYDSDKYLVVMDYHGLEQFKEKKFDILDQIKSITLENKIYATLSIGVGINGESPLQNFQSARAAMDIALGRGGDQVVIRDGEKLIFFGGRSQETEKRTKVKPRVVAYALKQLIMQADQVVIMGHQFMDMDALGAAVGICAGVRAMSKNGYIVVNTFNPSIEGLLNRLAQKEAYEDTFISSEHAIDLVDEHTLLVVVDTHRASYTDCPELLKKTTQIVLIDHHRRSAEFIQNAVLTFHEPFASSSSEMVTEMLQYLSEKSNLSALEAEAMYAGIVMDTKNFVIKTGVRTFEAAAYLRQLGVDPRAAKQMMQNNWETFIAKTQTMKDAFILHEQVAVAICPDNVQNARLVVAQVADELLSIAGILASFVLCKDGNQIVVSARSLGDWNVQVVLEKLGGGGHMTTAGVQLNDVTMEQAVEHLKVVIDEYLQENINIKEA